MSEIVKRIKEFIDYEGISVAKFERSIGMSNSSFGKSYKNKGSIGTDKLENFIRIYPNVSVNWLITGLGNMLSENTQNFNGNINGNLDGNLNGNLNPKNDNLGECQECIKKEGEIETLKQQIVLINELREQCKERVSELKDCIKGKDQVIEAKDTVIATKEAEIARIAGESRDSYNQSYAS